jgi:hypothetical protein
MFPSAAICYPILVYCLKRFDACLPGSLIGSAKEFVGTLRQRRYTSRKWIPLRLENEVNGDGHT